MLELNQLPCSTQGRAVALKPLVVMRFKIDPSPRATFVARIPFSLIRYPTGVAKMPYSREIYQCFCNTTGKVRPCSATFSRLASIPNPPAEAQRGGCDISRTVGDS